MPVAPELNVAAIAVVGVGVGAFVAGTALASISEGVLDTPILVSERADYLLLGRGCLVVAALGGLTAGGGAFWMINE